ncbi:amidohydrolase family protein [Marinicella sp. W31]|uniref:amidohydrolase family protein n=1 Tax=Marinicella sp. W31 TaxID=3023713 RepID=UPI0037570C4D
MKKVIYTLIVLVALSAFIWALPTPETSQEPLTNTSQQAPIENSFILKNIRLFDGERWHDNSRLIVVDGYISAATEDQQLPEIDGKQGYVIPGLIDAHTHAWGDALQQALRFGVTTELDMFTNQTFAQEARASRESVEQTNRADFFSAGTLVTSSGGHGTEYGLDIPTIDAPENAEQFVLDRIAEGSDYIKVVYNHKPEYFNLTSFSKDVLIAVIAAAHKHKKIAVVHISNHQSAIDAVEAGADGLVHTFGEQIISESLLTMLKDNNVFVIPTLSVIASMSQSDHSQTLADDPNLSDKISPIIRSGLKPFSNISAPAHYLQNAIQNTEKMHQQGIPILAGTDATNPGASHGVSMHGELELLVQSGLSPTKALQAAGSLTSKVFSLGSRGQLMQGSKADFILLADDPRKDIRNTRKMSTIWKNGYPVQTDISTTVNSLTLPADGLIADFSDNTLNSAFEQNFIATTDQMMQGQSTAEVAWIAEGCGESGALAVQGEIKSGFPYPWSGAFLAFSNNLTEPADFSKHKVIEFSVSGSPGQYQLMVFILNTMQPIQIPFEISEQCSTVRIDMGTHSQVAWDSVTGLAWVADRNRLPAELASFEFSLDNIMIHP